MFACRWLEVFALASCLAWTADALKQDLSQVTVNSGPKLVKISTELQLSPEGNWASPCIVLSVSATPRQSLALPNSERPPAETPQPVITRDQTPPPLETCSPPYAPTPVYNSESLLRGLSGAAANISIIQNEAKNYFVTCDSEKSYTKAQVLKVILNVMLANKENDTMAIDIKSVKSRIGSGPDQEAAEIRVVCLPDGFQKEEIVHECAVLSEANTASTEIPYSKPPTSELHGYAQQGEKPGIKAIMALVNGSASHSGHTVRSTPRPSARTLGTTAVDPPTRVSPGQTKPSLQFSLSGVITAPLPLSVSKLTAQLSLSFAPDGLSLSDRTNLPILPEPPSTNPSPPTNTQQLFTEVSPTPATAHGILSQPVNFTEVATESVATSTASTAPSFPSSSSTSELSSTSETSDVE